MAIDGMTLRERKKEAMRETLLDAALTLFERQGFAATTIEEITAHADVAPRTFFRYFANKAAILQPATDEYLELLASILSTSPHDEPVVTTLHRAIRTTLCAFHDHRARILRQHCIAIDAGHEVAGEEFANLWAAFEAIIATHVGADPFTDPEPALLTGIGIGIASGAVRAWLHDDANGDIGVLVDRGFATLHEICSEPALET